MRLFIIMFLFAVGVMRAADSYSQNVLLDIEVQNQTIEKVLGEIEKQSEFTFFYNDKQINVNRLVSVTVTKETIFKVNAARKSKVDDNTAKMQSIKQLGV